MSNANQETIEDIVAEMRNESHAGDESCLEWVGAKLLSFADRIEAAHQREVSELKSKMNDVVCENEALRDACGTCGANREHEATREKSSQVGNAAKIREALETISKCDISKEEDCYTLYRALEAALAAPPRNCDMYTTLDDARNAFFADYVSDETCSSATSFAIWLFDKARGATDGSK